MTMGSYEDTLGVVITTESDYNNARNLADHVLKLELSKCVSISKIESIYRWEGNIEEAHEYQLTIKTSLELLDHLIIALKKKHTYKLPQIICLRGSSSEEYKEWIEQAN